MVANWALRKVDCWAPHWVVHWVECLERQKVDSKELQLVVLKAGQKGKQKAVHLGVRWVVMREVLMAEKSGIRKVQH
jgi:hypothetical protein